MGSCIGRCWCSCCDCGFLSCGHHRASSVPITDLSSSTSRLFDSNQNPSSPNHGHRVRSDTTMSCIMRSWKRKASLTSPFNGKPALHDQQGFQMRPGSNQQHQQHQQQQPMSSIEIETLMCDFDIPEPTDRQVLELHSARNMSTNGGGHYKDHGGSCGGRRRVTPGSPHLISLAYNQACMEDVRRMDFTSSSSTTTTTTSRLLVQSSPASSGNRSHNLVIHHPLHSSPLHHRQCCIPDAANVTTASSSSPLDQSFPILHPLLSYTHETYLGNPGFHGCDFVTGSAITGIRYHHQQQQDHHHRSSPCSRGNHHHSPSAGSLNGNGDTGSLDGLEWDNYDENQIKPEHDDVNWFLITSDPGSGTHPDDGGEDEDSFAEVFKRS